MEEWMKTDEHRKCDKKILGKNNFLERQWMSRWCVSLNTNISSLASYIIDRCSLFNETNKEKWCPSVLALQNISNPANSKLSQLNRRNWNQLLARCPEGSIFNLDPDAMTRSRSKENWSLTFETKNLGKSRFLGLNQGESRFSSIFLYLTWLNFIFQSRWSLLPNLNNTSGSGSVFIPISIFIEIRECLPVSSRP